MSFNEREEWARQDQIYDEAFGPDDRVYAETYTEPEPGLEHSRAGDVWARYTGSPPRDREADRQVRQAILAEKRGEWDPETGEWRPCRWETV